MSDNKKGFSHESHLSKSVDWYTPSWVFEQMQLQFDLDPCQPVGGVPWIPASNFYTIEDDGLTSDWFGRVWLNPPYGKHTKDWLKKMHGHRNGMALLFARTDCAWFHDYCKNANAILFLTGRIKFVDGLQVAGGGGAGSGSMLIAWGDDCKQTLYKMRRHGMYVALDNFDADIEAMI